MSKSEMQFKIYVAGLKSKIGHNIAQRLVLDAKDDTKGYLAVCKELFVGAALPADMVDELLEEAYHMGMLDYATGFVQGHGGSQISPAVFFESDIEFFKEYLEKHKLTK